MKANRFPVYKVGSNGDEILRMNLRGLSADRITGSKILPYSDFRCVLNIALNALEQRNIFSLNV